MRHAIEKQIMELEQEAMEQMTKDRDQMAVFILGQIDILKARLKGANDVLYAPH